ncbi:MAG: putative Ig domain-containing protein [Burkholderiales bacterium]
MLSYSVPVDAFVDADVGDVLTYSAKQSDQQPLPTWLTFNAATRTFSGTAPVDFLGTLSVMVVATDKAGNAASDVFDWVVSANNNTITGTALADTLTGASGDDSLYGLGGNDTLVGNDGHDLLDGGAGVDSMRGGAGNDTYVFDAAGDVADEINGSGTDTVESSVSVTLASGIENLRLTGSAAINGTGNALSNLIVGNAQDNVLDGGVAPTSWLQPASDSLRGGAGNDTYLIRDLPYTTTRVEEMADEGIDTVEYTATGGSYTLPNETENLVLKGSVVSASGNRLNNVLTGNDANNFIYGHEGADTLYGLDGNDILEGGLEFGDYADVLDGGLGNDTYRYQLDSGHDTIVEALPDARVGKLNTLFIYGRGFASDVIPATLKRVGVDLEVLVGSGTDKITVKSS